MPQLYWDTALLSPFLAMDHRQLKRSRSGNATDRKAKRAKPLPQQQQQHLQVESPIESTLNPLYPNQTTSPIPTHVQHSPFVKSISISTKTPQHPQEQSRAFTTAPTATTATATETLESYENINDLLHNIHVERFGDPERRESWWTQQQQEEDVEMQDEDHSVNNEYNRANSVLRQAFLTRRHHY